MSQMVFGAGLSWLERVNLISISRVYFFVDFITAQADMYVPEYVYEGFWESQRIGYCTTALTSRLLLG